MQKKLDIYTRVTNKIIADLEKGGLTWNLPWNGAPALPRRHNGTPYQGINILLLWGAASENGYANPLWMTYRQAMELGGQVRKGSKGETVVYTSTIRPKSEPLVDEDGTVWHSLDEEKRFLKAYTVFNVDQIDELPPHYYVLPQNNRTPVERDETLDAFFSATGASVVHGGSRACYVPRTDNIHMPCIDAFRNTESYYAVLAHEMTHWTRHPSRLDRDFGQKRFGDNGYAVEELVAEIGAAFLCAALEITPETREDHAAYIESWLEVLRDDKRAIFQAASHAQRAVTYLQSLQPQQEEAA